LCQTKWSTVAFMKVALQFGLAFLLLTSSVSPLSGNTHKSPSRHAITFTFDYDFRLTPACSPTATQDCVQQFNLYEISPGIPNRVRLGSIPAPVGATECQRYFCYDQAISMGPCETQACSFGADPGRAGIRFECVHRCCQNRLSPSPLIAGSFLLRPQTLV
jgi:hypothetical protein